MPQLDSVSYLSQVFWLIFFFLLFYSIVMYSILPNLYKSMRIRQRKLELLESQKGDMKGEESSILTTFDQSLADSLSQSRKSLENSIVETNQWIDSNLKVINESKLNHPNKIYLESVYELTKEKLAFHKMTQEN